MTNLCSLIEKVLELNPYGNILDPMLKVEQTYAVIPSS